MASKKGLKLKLSSFIPFITFLMLFMVSIIGNSKFLTMNNINNLVRQSTFNGIISIGMTLVILSGGIDLSVGSVLACSGALSAILCQYNTVLAVVIPILFGLVIGLFNGFAVAKLKVPPIVATLVSMLAARGLAYIFLAGNSLGIPKNAEMFLFLGKGKLFDILPFPTLIMAILFILFIWILKFTCFGRNLYSIGGNEEAARMLGIQVDKGKILAYMTCGLLTSIAGILITARVGSALPYAGDGYEISSIATVVLGGTLITGGKGRMSGTFWASLTMAIIANMINMQSVTEPWIQKIIIGAILIVIIVIQSPIIRKRYSSIAKLFIRKHTVKG